jgi:chemotaxis protein MotC
MKILVTAFCLLTTMSPAFAEGPATETPAPAASSVGTSRLLHELDALFLLQDATARGRRDAAVLQKPLLLAIGKEIGEDASVEPDRLAPYVAGYVLSGGDPATAVTLSKSDSLSPFHRRLLEGVSLFMRGNRQEAAGLLKAIDVLKLPARVAGRVALAQALLEQDPAARQTGLAIAVALMPGTLVEESAVRRSTLAFAETADEKQFWKRLERYQRRFPDSLYARSFWEEVVSQLANWKSRGEAPDLTRLDLIVKDMPASRRRHLYLHLARASSTIDNVAFVEFGASRTKRLALEGSMEDQAARLYLSLYAVASEEGDRSLADLRSVNRNLLNAQDRALLDAGLWIAEQIDRPPEAGRSGTAEEALPKTPLETRAESLLADVDKILVGRRS